jgi:four helix bundle protein
MKSFTELQAWQEAHKLTLMVYKATQSWPREEMFGLTGQVRRAAISVESNIAEGHGRFNDTEFHHFCNMAKGSVTEVQCQLMIARDLGYLTAEAWAPLNEQASLVARLLQGLMRHLRPS